MAVFHYVPLHSSIAGIKFGEFSGEDKFTSFESERLVRLPMYFGLPRKDQEKIIEVILEFYLEY